MRAATKRSIPQGGTRFYVPGTYTVKQDRKIDSTTVICPDCHAQPGKRCFPDAAKGHRFNHLARRRMAIRKLNAERES
jgi:hypothetical protein